jgi:hypothetical protein
MRFCFFAMAMLSMSGVATAASITDLSTWTQVVDPPHPNLFTLQNVPTQTTLRADGTAPSGVDIGYASVNGPTVAGSTAGHFFDPRSDFVLSIDYDLTAVSSVGVAGIGFGIGESTTGENSAGIAIALVNGAPLTAVVASRVNDVNQTPLLTWNAPTASGSLHIFYSGTTQEVTFGVSLQGFAQLIRQRTLTGVTSRWSKSPLIPSFFLRSEGLSSGEVTAVFSNLRLLDGVTMPVPEPTTSLLAILGALGVLAVKKRTG